MGREAAIAHYSRPESLDGQWYLYMVSEDGRVIAHPDPQRLGLDLKSWVGTDANGYPFGREILSATPEGKWVSYVYRNPENLWEPQDFHQFELKNVWVVRHDGLLFASGWYISAEEFTKLLVATAIDRFRSGGLEETVEYFRRPGSALAGLESAVQYYNSAETVHGRWAAFIADETGTVVAHPDRGAIGQSIQEILGASDLAATPEGRWVDTQSLRMWIAEHDGFTFGSGWHDTNP